MLKALFKSIHLARPFAAGLALMLAVSFATSAAVASPGQDDIPELPAPDGSSDTPEMIIPMIDNTTTKLSSLRGQVVLLDFFLSTCPHCRDQAPHMVELYKEYSKRGLVILGLAADSQDKSESVKSFIKELKINYPVGFMTTEVIAYYTDSHNHGVPQIVLFGTNGKMVKRMIGWGPESNKELLDAILAQLQKLPTVKPGSKASRRMSSHRAIRA